MKHACLTFVLSFVKKKLTKRTFFDLQVKQCGLITDPKDPLPQF